MPDDATPTDDQSEPQILPELADVPETFDALDNEGLRALWATLEAARAARVEAAAELTGLTAVREARDAVQAIVDAQNRIAADLTERMALENDLTSLAQVPALPEPPAPAAEDSESDAATVDAPPADAPDPVVVEAVTAAVTGEAMDGPPATPPPNSEPARPRVAMRAAAGQPEQDSTVDFAALGEMVQRNRKGGWGRPILASIPAFEDTPEIRERMLSSDNSTSSNDRIVREATEEWLTSFTAAQAEPARTAAICDPLDIIREVPDCTTSATPFADSLPSRPAGRLGFTVTPGMSLADVASGVGYWTEEDQAAVDDDDSSTWKVCVAVECPTPTEVKAEAVTACLTFDNTTDMSNPERIRDALSKMSAQRARATEAKLLALADDESYQFTATAPYGSLDGFIHTVLTTLAQGTYAERIGDSPYLAFLSPGLLETFVIDRDHKKSLAGFESGAVIAYIEGELAAAGHNVRLVKLLDVAIGDGAPFHALPAVGTPTDLPQLGGSFRPSVVRLIAPTSALYFSTGQIDVGVQRSPELNRRNKAQFFGEEYVGLTKHGCDPWFRLEVTACPTGSRAEDSQLIECPANDS